MSQGLKIGVAVVGGYILGRRKKAKLALGMGLYLAGKKLNIDPKQVASLVTKQLGESPQLAQLREQAQGELVDVGKVAAGALVNRQANRFADALHQRTQSLNEPVSEPEPDDVDAEEEEPERTTARGKGGKTAPADRPEDGHEDEPADEAADEPPARAPARRRPAANRRSGSAAAKGGTSQAKTSSRGTATRTATKTATRTSAQPKRRKRSTGGES